MRLQDRIILGLRRRTLNRDAGVVVWRTVRWVVSRIAPYDPPRASVSEDRMVPFVNVEVRPSTVPGAGRGLFVLEQVPAGVRVGEYWGDLVDSVLRWLRLRNTDYVSLTANPTVQIDALRRPEALMRYINHHFDPRRCNARYVHVGDRVYVETMRDVAAGEELFCDYGETYWRLRGVRTS